MTAIAFRRMLSGVVVSPREVGRDLGLANRGWQDKAHKVRAVGCGWMERRFPAIPQTLCSTRGNLRVLAKCYGRSAFGTL
jgi:hypothetical protein